MWRVSGRCASALVRSLVAGPVGLNAAIGFMALVLYRVMRWHLGASQRGMFPERALPELRRIHHHHRRRGCRMPLDDQRGSNQDLRRHEPAQTRQKRATESPRESWRLVGLS
jgi:hypothetical protein